MLASSLILAVSSLAGLASAANQQIIVGGTNGLVYTPSNVTAEIGDTITFIFQSKNHTVTQSAFASPCSLLSNATTGATGFTSGFVPVAANATENPTWTLQVNVATPIWFYCGQVGHCEQGMVGSINAAVTGNKTFAAFKALALTQTETTTGSSVVNSGVGAVATGSLSSVAAGNATGSGASSSSTSTAKPSGAATLQRSGAALLACALLAVVVL